MPARHSLPPLLPFPSSQLCLATMLLRQQRHLWRKVCNVIMSPTVASKKQKKSLKKNRKNTYMFVYKKSGPKIQPNGCPHLLLVFPDFHQTSLSFFSFFFMRYQHLLVSDNPLSLLLYLCLSCVSALHCRCQQFIWKINKNIC